MAYKLVFLKNVLVIEHIISLAHATTMVRKFKVKKHARMGYFFELKDLGMNIWDPKIEKMFHHLKKPNNDLVSRFADYGGVTAGYHLKVYRSLA